MIKLSNKIWLPAFIKNLNLIKMNNYMITHLRSMKLFFMLLFITDEETLQIFRKDFFLLFFLL